MSETRKFAERTLGAFLRSFGFKKKGSAWVLKKKEFLIILGLQKSQWSEIYYINLGIQFDNLDEKLPKDYRGHVRYSVIKTVGGETKGDFVLDIELPVLQQLIKDQVIEPFGSLETVQEVKRVLVKDMSRYIVTVKGQEFLNISDL